MNMNVMLSYVFGNLLDLTPEEQIYQAAAPYHDFNIFIGRTEC